MSILDAPLQDIVRWQADRISHISSFERLIDCRRGERRVRPDDNGLPPPAVSINDGKQELVPPVRTVDVPRAKLRRETVAPGVEDEERVIADRLVVAVVRRLLLRPVDRALGAVDVEDHLP